MKFPDFGRDARVNALIGCGHFLSHYYQLCLPPLFIAWQQEFGVSFAELGLAMALMGGTSAVAQAPVGFLVDRYGARRFLIGGTSADDACRSRRWGSPPRIGRSSLLAMLSGLGNSVIHPADYAILQRLGRPLADRPLVRAAHLCRPCRVCRRAAGHRRADAADRLARDAAAGRRCSACRWCWRSCWQSRILNEQQRAAARAARPASLADLRQLLSRPILLFFGFFMVSSMAGAGIQSWLITVLHSTARADRSKRPPRR